MQYLIHSDKAVLQQLMEHISEHKPMWCYHVVDNKAWYGWVSPNNDKFVLPIIPEVLDCIPTELRSFIVDVLPEHIEPVIEQPLVEEPPIEDPEIIE